MKRLYTVFLVLMLMGCAPFNSGTVILPVLNEPMDGTSAVQQSKQAAINLSYPDLGIAPELSNEVWLNTDHALRIADMRGKVVLLEMWTFGCINCQNVLPVLIQWHARYQNQGLVMIGNHFPEFPYEKELENLRNAVQRLGIKYPVAQDNDGKTWSAYHNTYWPTLYLIDKRGHLRYSQIGEGRYHETEKAIQDLLNEPG